MKKYCFPYKQGLQYNTMMISHRRKHNIFVKKRSSQRRNRLQFNALVYILNQSIYRRQTKYYLPKENTLNSSLAPILTTKEILFAPLSTTCCVVQPQTLFSISSPTGREIAPHPIGTCIMQSKETNRETENFPNSCIGQPWSSVETRIRFE